MNVDFEKFDYEEVFRYFQFKRTDDQDGLADDETIISQTVTCQDLVTGVDCSSDMISNVSSLLGTQVIYKLKAGIAGNLYKIIIKVVTSNTQKLEGSVIIKVK